MTDPNKALDGIKDYLSSGGLFNPELMDHAAVRDLILDCRDAIDALKEALQPFADEAFRYEPDDGDSDLPIWDCQLTLGRLRDARRALEAKT